MHLQRMATPVKVELHFTVYEDDDLLTATCDEFPGLVTCAPTVERLLMPMLRDAIIGWFDALKKRGHIDEALATLKVDPGSHEINFVPVLRGDGQDITYALA
jgi:hypothetical protein